MSRGRSHRSDCQGAKNCKARHDVTHCTTSESEDGNALRQMLVHEVAELSYLQGYRYHERALLSDLGDQGVADHDLPHSLGRTSDRRPIASLSIWSPGGRRIRRFCRATVARGA